MDKFIPFSKRQDASTKPVGSDVYQYDSIPEPFRKQVIHIWNDAAGFYYVPPIYPNMPSSSDPIPMNWFWDTVVLELSRAYGEFNLNRRERDREELCKSHLLECDTKKALDIIELTFRMIDEELRKLNNSQRREHRIRLLPDGAIKELNERFQEHRLGYRFENGYLIKMESEYLHTEVTVPAIQLLVSEQFAGAAKEFLDAHEHYRHGRYDSAITEASNSFESTMKTIFERRGIPYEKNWPAKNLIERLFQADLLPKYLENLFSNLKNVLQALPTMRNKESAHGEGTVPLEIPPHLAAYALHLAAASTLFLVQAHKATPLKGDTIRVQGA